MPASRSRDALVVSTAVEDSVPDVRAARARGVPDPCTAPSCWPRFVAEHRTVAVTGTSGKSTVTAMIFEILRGAGLDPSVITGGDLVLPAGARACSGNAWAGRGDLLVIEADESDGSLVRYEPWAGVLLNLQRDHKEPEELAEIFRDLPRAHRGPFVMGEEANLDYLADGRDPLRLRGALRRARADDLAGGDGSRFTLGRYAAATPAAHGGGLRLPVPGRHNVVNAAGGDRRGRAVCGVPSPMAARPSRFPRRGAALPPARRRPRGRGDRRLRPQPGEDRGRDRARRACGPARAAGASSPFFQPHGFGPTRFLRDGLVDAFAAASPPDDRLYLPEIFYAGGTATRDISSADIADEVCGARRAARSSRRRATSWSEPIVAEARDGRPRPGHGRARPLAHRVLPA